MAAEQHGAAEGFTVRRRPVEVAVGAFAFVAGLVMMWETHRLGSGWVGGSPESG